MDYLETDAGKYIRRNLEGTVKWCVDHITGFLDGTETVNNFGIKILGVLPTIEDAPALDYQYGDAYAVGDAPPYVYWVYTRSGLTDLDGSFVNIGVFPAVGPKGEKGDKGDKGDRGEVGPQGATGKDGVQGARGEKGEKGDQGIQGAQGIQGVQGPAGGYNLYSELSSISQLPTPTKELQQNNAAYVVGSDKHLYMVMGYNTFQWYDLGTLGGTGLRGEPGIGIDTMDTINMPYGQSSVTVDTTDGITVNSNAQITYNGGEDSHQVILNMSMPIKAGTGIIMDATQDNEFAEVRVDTDYIDGRLYEVEEDVQTKYDNSVHRTKLPSDQAARVYTEYWDTATGTSKQGSTEYSRSAQPGYFAVRTSNGQLNAPNQSTYEPSDDQFVSKRWVKNNPTKITNPTSVKAVQVYSANSGTIEWVPIQDNANRIAGQIAVRESGGHLKDKFTIRRPTGNSTAWSDVMTTGQYNNERDYSILRFQDDYDFPESATSGTFPTAYKLYSKYNYACTNDYPAYIFHNNEWYYKADQGHTAGYVTFTHTGYENSTFIHKAITINTNNWTWILNTSE